MILPPKTQTIDQLVAAYDLSLCRRDYSLLVEHQPDFLADLEALVSAGATDDSIRQITYRRLTDETLLVQRIMNAARWIRDRNSYQTLQHP